MSDLMAMLGLDPSDPEVIAATEDVDAVLELIDELVAIRKQANLRQEDVAAKMQTFQPSISDFERLGADPHISTIQRYARAVGARLRLELEREVASENWIHVWKSNVATQADWIDGSVWQAPLDDHVPAPVVTYATNDNFRLAA